MAKLNYYPKKGNANTIELTVDEYEQSHGWTVKTRRQRDILGGFQPFLDAYKDLKNTFTAYKGKYQITSDLLQPIRGIFNLMISALWVLCGVILITLSPLVLFYAIGRSIYNLLASENTVKDNQDLADFIIGYLLAIIFIPVYAVNNLLRAITQIAFTPLTWLIKMPLRGLITLFAGWSAMEDSHSFQRLITMGNELLPTLPVNDKREVDMNRTSMPAIIKALYCKLDHGQEKKKFTNLTDEQIWEKNTRLKKIINACHYGEDGSVEWKPVQAQDLRDCLTFFSPKNAQLNAEDKNQKIFQNI